MRNIIFSFLLLIIAVASCVPNPPAMPTAMTIIHPTATPVSTITLTPKPSATISTPTSEIPSPTAEPFIMSESTSPNGEYIAYSYFYYGTEQQTIEIQDKTGKSIWQIPFQGELPHYDPRPAIGTYRWSNDSSQLYFCYYWSPDGGDIFIRYSCSRLQTIDVGTGEIQTVVPEGYTAFEISNDGSQIAYLNCNESCTMHIQNLSTGSEKTVSVIASSEDYVAIGGIFWSPSDKELVFHTQDKDRIMLQTIYLDTSTMKFRLIKKYAMPLSQNEWAAFDGWVDDNTLRFVESGKTGEQVIYLNINSNEFIAIGTPTPHY